MGFFFEQAGVKPKGPKSSPTGHASPGKRYGTLKAPSGARTGQQIDTLRRLGCRACPLNDAEVLTPKMEPTIPEDTLVYIIGEAPGKAEDEKGEPLIGPSGKLLRDVIPTRYQEHVAYDNVVRDRTPDGRTPAWVEVECCRGKTTASIVAAKPKVVLGLGTVALNWGLNSADMNGLRGRFFAVNIGGHKCWFFPTYHPSFVKKFAYDKEKPLNSRLGLCFRMDVERAFKELEALGDPIVDTPADAKSDILTFNGQDPRQFDKLMALLAEAAEARKVTLDFETQELRPFRERSKLLTASITFGKLNHEKHVAFALHHPKAGWSRKQLEAILAAFKKIIADPEITKVAHNAPFEIEWLISLLGLDCIVHEAWEDTMMLAQLIDERKGDRGDEEKRITYQSLGFLTKQYFGIDVKTLFKFNKRNMENEPLDEILLYNGVDTKYTHRLHRILNILLEENDLKGVLEDAKARSPAVAIMQWIGVDTDQQSILANQKRLQGEIDVIETEIQELKVVKQFVKDKGIAKYNTASTPETLEIFRDYLKRSEIKVPKKHAAADEEQHRFTVDKAALEQIDHPLAQLLLKLRNRTKIKSTYVDEMVLGTGSIIYPDKKLHTSFNLTVAETGRTSSDEPNLQNWPKRTDAWVRGQIVAPKNHILIAMDYGQLEYCTTAMCTKDKIIVDSIWTGYDVHMEWATRLGKLFPEAIGGKEKLADKDFMKKFRGKVKNKIVFPAIFGATNNSMAGYMSLPVEVIDDLMDDFWKSFDGLHDWQRGVMRDYYNEGYVETLNGRRRRYPLTKNQVINHPIQGTAAEIVCDAMVRLSKMAHESGMYFLHPVLNIHDDLTFAVPDHNKDIEECIEIIYTAMLSVPYKFVNVPMAVEASIGYNWAPAGKDNPYGMEEIGKFYSNKDLKDG